MADQVSSLIDDPPIADLATVRRAQLTAFWNAPRAAHCFLVLAAIERGWRELTVTTDETAYTECQLAGE